MYGDIIDRQTIVFSIYFPRTPSAIMNTPLNLRFAADELILKTISYINNGATPDVSAVVQIWCNITNDNLIGSFPNAGPNNIPVFITPNQCFRINNTFQTGVFQLTFQQTENNTGPIYYNPQATIDITQTTGTVVVTIEFVKHAEKK